MMISAEQFEKAKQFIYRHGDLLTRKRFAYHFEGGSQQAVLDALACYQNDDGGFGNGLELDVMCPDSSGICTEMALGHLWELNIHSGPLLDRTIDWVMTVVAENDVAPHPIEAIKKYPHGGWWADGDDGNAGRDVRIMSIAAFLELMGRGNADLRQCAANVFEATHIPFPEQLGVYSYPAALFLRHVAASDAYPECRVNLQGKIEIMFEKEAWHHPLFFCHHKWESDDIPASLWRAEAARVIATLQDDGGIFVERYADLIWWRPVWTLDMLVTLKQQGLFDEKQLSGPGL